LRGLALGRKSWIFAGSERGAERAAVMYTLIQTCLCRARHKQVYADRRTMPSGPVFPRIPCDRHVIGSA
jgi:transposase